MILSNGMCVSPLKGQGDSKGPQKQGFRDTIRQIDNGQDLKTFVLNHASKIGPKHKDPEYVKHPVGLRHALIDERPSLPCIDSSWSRSAATNASASTSVATGLHG